MKEEGGRRKEELDEREKDELRLTTKHWIVG